MKPEQSAELFELVSAGSPSALQWHPPTQNLLNFGGLVVSGRCLEGVWRVSGGCLEGAWEVSEPKIIFL